MSSYNESKKVRILLLRVYQEHKVACVLKVESNILRENRWNKKLNISTCGNQSE